MYVSQIIFGGFFCFSIILLYHRANLKSNLKSEAAIKLFKIQNEIAQMIQPI